MAIIVRRNNHPRRRWDMQQWHGVLGTRHGLRAPRTVFRAGTG